ncbi:uncharacterized protein LOC142349723 isoform X2 [Convolutriloba macropyga]|uniref:uncharacterized protein LOC142349723 isoform X2 n=1 Tax=Convolutriloba macropyga TaxID=536237 RepID=UPI003F528455
METNLIDEDNPIVANGGSHGSNSSLDKVEGGATVAGKKIDDEDEDEQSGTGTSDQDTFMFGMSKLRTFFFFLSLALLVAFVLVFVFVLPCSQTAQMDERTNKVTDHASPGSVSKLGDMDGDGKDDVAFFTPSQKSTDDSSSSKKKRRDAEATDEEATCIVDGESQPCVGEIAVVSASVGTPIGVRSIGVVPELNEDGSTIKCVSGGSRQKMSCLITSGGKVYSVDMKAPTNSKARSNMTTFPVEDCEGQKVLPISVTKESDVYGFFYSCKGGQAYFIEAPSMTKHSVSINPVSSDKIFDQLTIHHQTKVATLYANGTEYLSLTTSQPARKAGAIAMDTVGHFDFPVSPEGDWQLVSASVGFLMFSEHNLVVPHEIKETSNTIAFPNNKITSVAKDRDVKYTLVQLCGETSCLYHMYDVTALKPEGDNAPVVQSASVSKFHLSGAMPVQYVVGASYNYFVAWNFLEVKEEDKTVTEDSSDDKTDGKEKAESNEVESEKKRRNSEQECTTKIEAQMLGFSANSFKKPALLYKSILCPNQQMKFVMLSGQHSDQPTYTFAVDGEQTSSVFGIVLPENSFVNKQGMTTEGWIAE